MCLKRRGLARFGAVACWLVSACSLLAVPPASNVAAKKLIRVAQELSYHSSAQDVPAKVKIWQETGYDGLCFTLFKDPARLPDGSLNQKDNMVFQWWAVSPVERTDFATDIQALKSVPDWGRLTDNFLWMAVHVEGTRAPNWFSDSDWEIVLHNTRVAAELARELRFKGILFDMESYGGAQGVWRHPWDYPLYAKADYKDGGEAAPRPFAEVAGKVRERGRQWAEALSTAYPEVVLFVIAGLYECVWQESLATGKDLEGLASGLYAPFVDGVLVGLGPHATLVSGSESTYLNSQYRDMLTQRDACLNQSLCVSTVPDLARQRITFAAGIWTDAGYGATGRFSNTDPRVNQRSPEVHRHAVHNALAASDRYAWQWGEWGATGESNFLTTEPTPLLREYWQANRDGHQPQDLRWEPAGYIDLTDYTQKEADAAAGEAGFWAAAGKDGWTPVAVLPEYWKFRFDPELKVRYSNWTTPDFDDSGWYPIKTTACWQSQGTRANGPGVYRVRFDVPATLDPARSEVRLAFGGLGSGAGHVYVNGGWIAWLSQQVDVAGAIKPGATNQITLVCQNRNGPGGLLGRVKLLARPKP
jgi:hypothetical protein